MCPFIPSGSFLGGGGRAREDEEKEDQKGKKQNRWKGNPIAPRQPPPGLKLSSQELLPMQYVKILNQ